MKSIYNYIQKYNYTFKDKEFNLIDNIILSQISYIPFYKIDFKHNLTIEELNAEIKKHLLHHKLTFLQRDIYEMVNYLSTSIRYKDAKILNYEHILNDKKQFGAVTIILNDNSKYISFEGTDGSMIGWKENFVLAYLYPTETQKSAIKYLNKNLKLTDKNVRIGGHSKGGNLAMAAYLNCHLFLKNKISTIYNNDGPGFKKTEYNSIKYKDLLSKLVMIVPNQSIVGMLLLHPHNYIVVKSNSIGIYAHNVFSWEIKNNSFIQTDLVNTSHEFEEVITKWFLELSNGQLIILVNTIFNLIQEAGIKNTNDFKNIKIDNMLKLTKNIKDIDDTTRKQITEILTLLKNALKENILKPINNLINKK